MTIRSVSLGGQIVHHRGSNFIDGMIRPGGKKETYNVVNNFKQERHLLDMPLIALDIWSWKKYHQKMENEGPPVIFFVFWNLTTIAEIC